MSAHDPAAFGTAMAALASSVKKGVPMVNVPDIAATLDWYVSIGFTELARFDEGGEVTFGMVSFGGAELMLNLGVARGARDVKLWFYTDKVDELYRLFTSRPLTEFVEQIYDPFYGGRQFSILDPNGYTLLFLQPG